MLHEIVRGLVAQSDGSGYASFIFPAAIAAVMYFVLIRPQGKQAKEQQALTASLKKGDEVVTSSGIIGRIHSVDDKIVTLEVASGTKLRLVKSFVQARTTPAVEAEPDAKADKKEETK